MHDGDSAESAVALAEGEVGCAIFDDIIANDYADTYIDFKILGNYFEEDYVICVSKDNPELLDDINDAIKKLKKNGTIDSIIQNYISY